MLRGSIINIQKYSVHDGPGIRTTIFFKGCPLNCWWCHNPESQNFNDEIMYFEDRCKKCGKCIEKCPTKSLEIKDNKLTINKKTCILCENCCDFCSNEAREYVGKKYLVKELMKEIKKDEIFYEESNGGVTFSGGEPLCQGDFLAEILGRCKSVDIHTTVDTSGFVSWSEFEKIIDKVDLFLYDLKIMDDEIHKKYTGVSNKLIIDNLKRLSQANKNIYVRIPIIKGVNDNDLNVDESIKLLKNLNIIQVNLLPYHKMGMDKYKKIGMNYKLTGFEKPSSERMSQIELKFKEAGLKVKIGG